MTKIKFIAVAVVCLLCACAARAQMGGPTLVAVPSTGTGFGTPPTSPNGATLLACAVAAAGEAVNSFCLASFKIGRTNTIATDTIDCVPDRGLGVLETFNGAVNVTVPQTGAGNCTGGFGFFIIASNKTGNVTTPTLNLAVGQISSGGGPPSSSLLLNPGQVAYVYTDSSAVNYLAAVIGGITGLTSGYVPQATSTSGLTNSPCD